MASIRKRRFVGERDTHQAVSTTNSAFIAAYTLWLVASEIDYSNLHYLSRLFSIGASVLQVVALLIAAVICLRRRFAGEQIILLLCVIPIVAYAAYCTGRMRYAVFLLFSVACGDTEFDDIINITLRVNVTILLVMSLLSLIGAIPDMDYQVFGRFGIRNGIQRRALGLAHPNGLGGYVFAICGCEACLHRRQLGVREVGVRQVMLCLACALFSYFVPNSQGATLNCVALALVLVACMYWPKLLLPSDGFRPILLSVVGIFSNVYSVFVARAGVDVHPIVRMIDDFASSRLYYSHLAYSFYGVSLFGRRINVGRSETADVTFLDNTYVDLLVRHGVLVYVIMSILLIVLLYQMGRSKPFLGYLIALRAVSGISGNGIFELDPWPILLLATVIFTVEGKASLVPDELVLDDREAQRVPSDEIDAVLTLDADGSDLRAIRNM